MYDVPAHDIVAALEADALLDFKQNTGSTLRKGICPQCGKRELYISINEPWQLKCPRDNNCGYEETTRSRYPHLWEDLAKRVPPTTSNPHATADAFLQGRGFDTSKLRGIYTQEVRKMPIETGGFANVDVVRFPLWDGHYWDRLLNEKDTRQIGDKARTSSGLKYAGRAWQSPQQKIQPGSRVFITEGIFHTLALMFAGEQAIAAISSSNCPTTIIDAHKGENITWIIAFDDDNAGRKYASKYHNQLSRHGHSVKVALTGSSEDWDDIYKAGKLTAEFIEESIWRGDLFTARTINDKAYHYYRKTKRPSFIIDFENRLYSISVDIRELTKTIDDRGQSIDTTEGHQAFLATSKCNPISNCNPVFRYCEQDKLTGDIAYYFDVATPHGSYPATFTGSNVDAPGSFNKALLNKVPGATFDGDAFQLKTLKDRWFNASVMQFVETVPFIGYDKSSQVYIFPGTAYAAGRELKQNTYGYFSHGKHRIKTSFKSIHIAKGQPFNPDWLEDYISTFTDNGLVVLAFWLGSLFAEQIRARHSSWPFLEMSGMPGTGKSTALEYLWKCVGREEYEGFDPSKASFAARTRAFTQVANLPVVLIEGDRVKDAKKGSFDYNELKTAYNGRSVRSMGAFNRGNETIEPPFRGSIIIAQNDQVDAEPAVLERIVHVEFTKAHYTPQTKQLADKLSRTPTDLLAGFLQAALEKETSLLGAFEQCYPMLENHYISNGKMKNGRVIKNHAMVAAWGYALAQLFPAMNKKGKTGTRYEELANYIEQRGVDRETRLVADHPLVQQFWETYELLENINSGEGIVKIQLNHSCKPDQIAISLPHVWQVAEQYKYRLPPMNELKPLLRTGVHYRLTHTNLSIRSAIWREKTVRCWIFEQKRK